MRLRILLSLLLFSALALSLLPCEAMKDPREAYLPLKIEVSYAYTMNFTLTVTPSIMGSSWRETKDNRYMSFECKESRDTFRIVFTISYLEPVEQIVTVKYTEGKRLPITEFIHYTNGEMDPYASRREAPSKSIVLRFLVRTVPEPTDPNYIAELIRRDAKAAEEQKERNDERRHQELMDRIGLLFGLFVVVVIAILVKDITLLRRERR